MGRSNKSPLTSTTDLHPDGNRHTCKDNEFNNSHNGSHCECKDALVNMTSCTSAPTPTITACSLDPQRSKGDPDGTRQPDCHRLVPDNSREKDEDTKSKKKGRKRKKKERSRAEETNVCVATVAEEYQNTCQNTCNKNYPKIVITSPDAESPQRTEQSEQMREDTPPPEGTEGHNMAAGKKGKKRRKKSKGPGGHETSRCLEDDDLTQEKPEDNITTTLGDHESSIETSTSHTSPSKSTGANNDMQLRQSPGQNRIRAKLEANAAGLEELHILKQSQLAKVQEALAMVKQRCRPELNASHMSPPMSPSRLGLKSFSWSFDASNGSSSSLYNEPISEADEDLMRPRAATFSSSKDGEPSTSPLPSRNSTPLRRQFTQTRSLSGTKLTYSFPSPMHAVLLQYESLSSIDGKEEDKKQDSFPEEDGQTEENKESLNHHSIVRRRDVHGEDHKTVVKPDANSNNIKSVKRRSDSGLLDMRHILRELSQEELNSPTSDIKNVEYPFKKLTRSASMGAYDKKAENRKFVRSNSFRKARSQNKPTKRNFDKENEWLSENNKPTIEPMNQRSHSYNVTKSIVEARKQNPILQTRVRSFSLSESRSPAAKRMVLLRDNSVSCTDIDKSPDPNKSSLPQKPKCTDSSDDEDVEKMQGTKAVNPSGFYPMNNEHAGLSSTSLSDLHSGDPSAAKTKPKSKVMSMMTKLRSHGSLDHLFQKRWRNSLSKIDLNVNEGSSPEWDYPTRHRSVSDLNPKRRYSTVVFPDMTVISMPERSCPVIENISRESNHSKKSFHSMEKDELAINTKTVLCGSSHNVSQSHSVARAESLTKPNYLKLKRRPGLSVTQAAC